MKPEFWTSEQIMELSRDARLLFIGMWNFCDDGGNHPASAKTLKAQVFPGDDLTSADIRRMIDELFLTGLLVGYEVDKIAYWHVTGWHHQKIDRPNIKHPPPPTPPANPHGPYVRRALDESSTNDRRTFVEQSPPEGKGREGSKHAARPEQAVKNAVVHISVPDGTALNPKILIFTHGVELLKNHGTAELPARSFLGKFASIDEGKLAGLIGYLMTQPKIEPKSYIAAAFQPQKRELVL